MTFNPIGVVVMISGPGDTSGEVEAVREEINDWNSQHAIAEGVVFISNHFLKNTVPIYRKGGDGQAVINEQISNDSDVVIALFKYKLGTPTTRNSKSGTVEEADVKEADGKVHVYFWGGPVPQDVAGNDQWKRLGEFREEFHANLRGLYMTYSSNVELREQVRRALWKDAKAVQATISGGAESGEHSNQRNSHLPATTTTSDVQVSVALEAEVWWAPVVGEVIELMISEDIRQEHEWAGKYNEQGFDIDSLTRSMLRPGTEPRKPKRLSEIDDWANSVRAHADEMHEVIAGAAAAPVNVKLNSDKMLERVEVEIIFEGVVGVQPSDITLDELWPALNPIPRHPLDFPLQKLRVPVRGPLNADWVQDGSDVVLTLKLNELRKRRVPVDLNDTVVLRVPSLEPPASQTFRYTWRVSAAGTDEEWSGFGEIPLIGEDTSRAAVLGWHKEH